MNAPNAASRAPVRRALDALYDGAGVLAAVSVVAIFVVMIGTSALRTLGVPTGGTEDVVSWLCAASAFLALAHTCRHGDFVRMTLVLDALSPARRRAFEAFALTVGFVFTVYLSYWAVESTRESFAFGDMSQGLIVVPLWIPQLSFAIGSVLLAIALLDELVRVLVLRRTPTYVEAVEARHAAGDYSEDL